MLAGAGEQFGGGRRRGGARDRQPSVVDHPVRVERLAAANGGEGRQQRADRQAGGLAQDALQRSLNLTDCSIADLAYAVVRGVRVAVRLRSGASRPRRRRPSGGCAARCRPRSPGTNR